jgi:hypothetical protein
VITPEDVLYLLSCAEDDAGNLRDEAKDNASMRKQLLEAASQVESLAMRMKPLAARIAALVNEAEEA